MKDVKNIERVRNWQQKQKSKWLCIECSCKSLDYLIIE